MSSEQSRLAKLLEYFPDELAYNIFQLLNGVNAILQLPPEIRRNQEGVAYIKSELRKMAKPTPGILPPKKS